MLKEGYTPLDQAFTSRVKANLLTLPFSMEERVEINIPKITKLAQIGGIRNVSIINDKEGETTKVVHQVVGMHSDGSALSGAVSLSTVPTSSSEIKGNDEYYHSARWADLTIKINTEETKRRLLESDQKVNSPEPWANEVNKAVKKELLKAGNKQLLHIIAYDIYSMSILYGLDLAAASGNPDILTGTDFLLRALNTGVVWNFVRGIFSGIEKHDGTGSRATLFIGPELDRALVLNIASGGMPLIRSMKT